MFNDYGKVKRMLNGSFEEIQRLMNERELSYDEIKDLMELLPLLEKINNK